MSIIGPIVRNDLFFFVTISRWPALMVLFDAKRRETCAECGVAGGAPEGGVDGAAGAAVDGVGVRVLFHVYRHADRGVCICQEPERAVAGHAGSVFTNGQVEIPLAQSFRWRLAPLPGAGERAQRFVSGCIRAGMARSPRFSMPARFAGRLDFSSQAVRSSVRTVAAPINGQSVGTAGGCNPIPLKATQTADSVIIQEADIAAGSRVFEKQ